MDLKRNPDERPPSTHTRIRPHTYAPGRSTKTPPLDPAQPASPPKGRPAAALLAGFLGKHLAVGSMHDGAAILCRAARLVVAWEPGLTNQSVPALSFYYEKTGKKKMGGGQIKPTPPKSAPGHAHGLNRGIGSARGVVCGQADSGEAAAAGATSSTKRQG